MSSILIVLASYNGEKYIEQQVNSILNQTYKNWVLLIRDDNSTDNTPNILDQYAKIDPRILIIKDNLGNLGCSQNFAQLMHIGLARDEPYLMFSDQDDFWYPDKIEITLKAMLNVESQSSIALPILIHTDLKVVDCTLNTISHSYWKYQHITPAKAATLNRLLCQNVVTGCTVMINRPLLKAGANMPKNAIMHDWWLTLIAACFGKITAISTPTTAYRQHFSNKVGATQWGFRQFYNYLKSPKKIKASILRSQDQAQAFLSHFEEKLNNKQRFILLCYSTLRTQSFFWRRLAAYKNHFLKIGIIRNIAFYLFL